MQVRNRSNTLLLSQEKVTYVATWCVDLLFQPVRRSANLSSTFSNISCSMDFTNLFVKYEFVSYDGIRIYFTCFWTVDSLHTEKRCRLWVVHFNQPCILNLSFFYWKLDWTHEWKELSSDKLLPSCTNWLYFPGWSSFYVNYKVCVPRTCSMPYFPYRRSQSFRSAPSWLKMYLLTVYRK